jgi:nucleoside-diphosphate kinase
MERTLIIIKPDAIQRQIIGEIVSRFERAGLKIVGMKMMQATYEMAQKHYPDELIPIIGEKTMKDWDAYGVSYTESAEEIGKIIVEATRKFLIETPVVPMVLEGGHAVEVVRKMVGSTGPKDSLPGTIRGDYAHISLGRASVLRRGAANIIHASGNVKEAEAEIAHWFSADELFQYTTVNEHLTHA